MAKNLRFDSSTYTLTWHLFRRYISENDMTTKDQERVTMREFYVWVNEQEELFPDRAELIETYDLDDEAFELVEKLFSDPFIACSKLYVWWPMLVLAGRKPLKHKPTAIMLSFTVQYEDGQQACVQLPLRDQVEPYTDGMVMTLWRGQLAQVSEVMAIRGVDELYDENFGDKSATSVELQTVIPRRPGGLGF